MSLMSTQKNPASRLLETDPATRKLEMQRNRPMHPLFDPEGQLAAYELFSELLDREKRQGNFFGPIIAVILATAITPAAFWLLAVVIELGTKA